MRIIRPGDVYRDAFAVSNGGAVDADSLPTVAVYKNGTVDGAVTPTVTSVATGAYKYSFTVPGGYAAGDVVQALITAVIGGTTFRAWGDPVTLSQFPATALPNAAAGAAGGLAVIGSAPLSNLDASVAAVKTKTDSLTFTAAGKVDANVLAVNGQTGGAARFDRATRGIVLGTVGPGATTSLIPTSALDPAAEDANQFKGRILVFDKDTATDGLKGQVTEITASNGDGTLTVKPLTQAPASGDTFTIQ